MSDRQADSSTVRKTISPALRIALWLLALDFVAIAVVKHGVYRPLTIHGVDYPKHWYAARAVLEQRSTYINHRRDDDLWLAFNYPQWSAMATAWLAFLDFDTAQIAWKMMHLAGLGFAWAIAWKAFAPTTGARAPAAPETKRERKARAIGAAINLGVAAAIIAATWRKPQYEGDPAAPLVSPTLVVIVAGFAAAWIASRWASPGGIEPDKPDGSPADRVRAAIAANWGLAAGVMVAGYSPAGASSLYIGQIDPANALLATAFVGALLGGWPFLAGLFLAMLCLVKMIPVFLLLPILLWRKWRIGAGWLCFMAAYAATLVVTGRFKYEWFFVHEMAKEVTFHWRWISGSIHRFIIKFMLPAPWHDTRELFDRAAIGITLALAAIYSGAIVAIRRRGWDLLRAIETALLYVPLFSPLFEPHHMAWAMPAMFLHARRWINGEMGARTAVVCSIGWGIVALDFFFQNIMQSFTPAGWHQYYVMYGALLLAVASTVEAMATKPAPGAARP